MASKVNDTECQGPRRPYQCQTTQMFPLHFKCFLCCAKWCALDGILVSNITKIQCPSLNFYEHWQCGKCVSIIHDFIGND